MYIRYPKVVLGIFLLLCIGSVYVGLTRVKFSFDLEDFFPTGDEDLEFFNEFRERFEPDDNFMMVALRREEGIFDSTFLDKAHRFSVGMKKMEFPFSAVLDQDTFDNKVYRYNIDEKSGDSTLVLRPFTSIQSILQFEYPMKTPLLGYTSIPAVHRKNPSKYERDKKQILEDERLVGNLISKDAKTMVVFGKTHPSTSQELAKKIVYNLHDSLDRYGFEEYHLLGPANFQTRLVESQIWEFAFSTMVSSILILLVMFLIFRRFWGVMVAMLSITVGLILFVGFLGAAGRQLDTMAMLYPIIMIIVGTSDVIHVMSKYVDELFKGKTKQDAIKTTIREIGMSIFLTSTTTAIGFLSLLTSRIAPIRNFGVNSAVGVMIAYISVLFFTTTLLTLLKKEQIIKMQNRSLFWPKRMRAISVITKTRSKLILGASAVLLGLCVWGISLVTTNNRIEDLLPIGAKVTEDFQFFEQEFSGFRPLEVAVIAKDSYTFDDYRVVKQVAELEKYLDEKQEIQSITSITALYKSINRAEKGNKVEHYTFPDSESKFKKYDKIAKRFAGNGVSKGSFVSADGKNARISARILDVGADSVRLIVDDVDAWINANIDTNMVSVRQTGTGVIVDKNSIYMRDSLLKGLGFAILVVSLIMGLLYRNVKMVFIAMIPNILPLLIAGALLGFLGIPLEAGVAIVFSIIFGIAVDDTIHLLGRFRLVDQQGIATDEAVRITLEETGKAVILTSFILFFGFLILLFSTNPPAITVGLLIGLTLVSAVVCDLFLIPVLLRMFIKKD